MPFSDEYITIAKQILNFLSWKRIFYLGLIVLTAIILVISGILTLPNGSKKFVEDTAPTLKISASIKKEIDDAVTKSDNILAIQIVTISFQTNIRTETYLSTDSPAIKAIYNEFINNRVIKTPLFDSDKINNLRIIRLINGEFVCVPYREATAYKYAPKGENYISSVCAIAIPPSYGEFSGILTIYLKSVPDKNFTEQLFIVARDISFRIYDENKK